jgi:uncharacterized linocin/CFP29 family protein
MGILRRDLAPISAAGWKEIEEQAKRILKLKLAARKLVDFEGPLGLDAASVNLGRLEDLQRGPVEDVTAARREVLQLIELSTDFELSRVELDAIDRGAADADLDPLLDAASRIAHAEDSIVFHGYEMGSMRGIAERSSHAALAISENYEAYPGTVAEATRLLRMAGIDGPYGIALGPRCYTGLMQATERGGYPVLELVKRVIDGPVVWAPAVDGALVLSMRGGDFELTVGQDISIGYHSHNSASVRLYVIESLAFRVLAAEAAVALVYDRAGARSEPSSRPPQSGRRQRRKVRSLR